MLDCWTGIDLLLTLQDFRTSLPDFVTRFFEIISSSVFYLLIPFFLALVFYLFIDKRAGDRIMINTISAYNLNNLIKFVFKQPRPWVLDPNIQPTEKALDTAAGYSFPSAHSSISTSGYGTVILYVRKNWIRILLILLIATIVFARVFLCVHTPLDVIVGVLLALAIIFINTKVLDYAEANDGRFYTISLIYLAVFTVFFVCILLTIDADRCNTLLAMGMFYGAFIGRVLDRAYIHYEIMPMSTKRKILFTLVGILGLAIFVGIPLKLKIDTLCAIGGIISMIWVYVVCPLLIRRYAENKG